MAAFKFMYMNRILMPAVISLLTQSLYVGSQLDDSQLYFINLTTYSYVVTLFRNCSLANSSLTVGEDLSLSIHQERYSKLNQDEQ